MTTMTLNPTRRQKEFLQEEQWHSDVIYRAMEFNMEDVIARYMKDEGLTKEIALEHERELKRFLAMCALNPNAHYGMRGPIDEIWHTFLMFTRDYAQFCEIVAGRFIHHVPETGKSGGKSGESYIRFLEDYEKIFGQPAPAEYWPRPALPDVSAECQGCNTCSAPEAIPSSPMVVEASCSECNGCGDSG